jgi:hypothetical protein
MTQVFDLFLRENAPELKFYFAKVLILVSACLPLPPLFFPMIAYVVERYIDESPLVTPENTSLALKWIAVVPGMRSLSPPLSHQPHFFFRIPSAGDST